MTPNHGIHIDQAILVALFSIVQCPIAKHYDGNFDEVCQKKIYGPDIVILDTTAILDIGFLTVFPTPPAMKIKKNIAD
jgi:hypothetical protein